VTRSLPYEGRPSFSFKVNPLPNQQLSGSAGVTLIERRTSPGSNARPHGVHLGGDIEPRGLPPKFDTRLPGRLGSSPMRRRCQKFNRVSVILCCNRAKHWTPTPAMLPTSAGGETTRVPSKVTGHELTGKRILVTFGPRMPSSSRRPLGYLRSLFATIPRSRAQMALAPAVLLALIGCSPASRPTLIAGPDPATPGAGSTDVPYRPVIAGTVHYQPVELKPWSEINERVAPPSGRAP